MIEKRNKMANGLTKSQENAVLRIITNADKRRKLLTRKIKMLQDSLDRNNKLATDAVARIYRKAR